MKLSNCTYLYILSCFQICSSTLLSHMIWNNTFMAYFHVERIIAFQPGTYDTIIIRSNFCIFYAHAWTYPSFSQIFNVHITIKMLSKNNLFDHNNSYRLSRPLWSKVLNFCHKSMGSVSKDYKRFCKWHFRDKSQLIFFLYGPRKFSMLDLVFRRPEQFEKLSQKWRIKEKLTSVSSLEKFSSLQ